MKKTRTILIVIIILVIAGLLILPKINFSNEKEPAMSGRPGSMKIPVDAYVVKPKKLLDRIVTTGTILANEDVELKSEISGKISKILFNEGSSVRKGDLLVKINDDELQAQLLKTNYTKKLLEQREFRQKKMLEREAISQEEYDIALNELNTVNAEIQLIKAQIDKTEIRAPFDGIIGLKSISPGSYVSPATSIATIQNINPVKIDFSVPEKYFSRVKAGNEIHFRIQGSDKDYTGKVYAVEPKINLATRTLQVRAISQNERSEIFPGSFAEIDIILEEKNNALMLPSESVVPDLEGKKVYKINNGKAQQLAVETGIRQEREVEVVKGVAVGDTIVTSGVMQLKPGAAVNVNQVK